MRVTRALGHDAQPPCPAAPLQEHAAGRDLHSALRVVKLGSNERLFSW